MDGIILVNKEKGMSSHDVVSKVRKILNTKKVGHAGTLDPMATGVLTILVGKGTKLSKFLAEHDKTYIAKLKLGNKTSTGDCEGDIIAGKAVPYLDKNKISNVLASFVGKQLQTPPIYSAIKVNGKKLYDYARCGECVDIPIREIEVYSIELIEFIDNCIEFEVSVSKGTYIRTLCEDIAEKLGTVGTMIELQRTRVDNFCINNAVTLDNVTNDSVIPIEKIFEDIDKINLTDTELKKFLNGIGIESNLNMALIYSNGIFIGTAINKNGRLIRDIIVC